MIQRSDLVRLGFEFREDVNDYVLVLSHQFQIRVDLRKGKACVFIRYDIVEGVANHWDIVYLGVLGITSLGKLIHALERLIKWQFHLGVLSVTEKDKKDV